VGGDEGAQEKNSQKSLRTEAGCKLRGGTEESFAWARTTAPMRGDMLNMISALASKLTPQELRCRVEGFQQFRAFIERAAAVGGISAPVLKSFPAGLQIRVDLEVINGEACVPEKRRTKRDRA